MLDELDPLDEPLSPLHDEYVAGQFNAHYCQLIPSASLLHMSFRASPLIPNSHNSHNGCSHSTSPVVGVSASSSASGLWL